MTRGAVIVGLGSIGRRHERLLGDLGLDVSTVSRRAGQGDHGSICEAVRARPHALLVVATETASHIATLQEARAHGHRGPAVIEKPLAAHVQEASDLTDTDRVWVAYNLRFSPVVQALRSALEQAGESPLAARMHVGQHLETWRPGANVAQGYSAYAARGGGVLRDLSHELDLAQWLFGRASGLCALGGRRGAVTVDSDDCWTLLVRTDRGVDIGLSLNYFDRPATRYIHVNTANHTYQADLISGVLAMDGVPMTIQAERDASYRGMWTDVLSALEGTGPGRCCSFAEGLEIMRTIADCEASAAQRRWIER